MNSKKPSRQLLIALLILFSILSEHAVYAATTSIDYVAQGNSVINKRLSDLQLFIAIYQKNKEYLNGSQIQQIESQYNAVMNTYSTIQTSMKNDSADNLQNDYNNITNGVYFYEEKLPLLYSELFTFKASYLLNKYSAISTEILPLAIHTVSKNSEQTDLTLGSSIASDITTIQTSISGISTDYSDIANVSTYNTTNQAIVSKYKQLFTDIKTRQKKVDDSINNFNDNFSKLITLYND